MNTWYYGYANIDGLQSLKEDPETIAVELFYDDPVKKEIGDEKKKELWSLSNRTFKEADKLGVVFKVYLPDVNKEEIFGAIANSPKEAMPLIHKYAIHIDLGVHATTLEVAREKWFTLCKADPALEPLPVQTESQPA